MTDWIYITHYSTTLQHCKCRYYKLLHSHKTVSIITIHSVFLILTHAQNRNIVPVIIWFLYSIEFLIHFKSLKMSFCNCAARNCKSIIKFAYYKQLIDSLNHKTYNQSCVLVELYWIALIIGIWNWFRIRHSKDPNYQNLKQSVYVDSLFARS